MTMKHVGAALVGVALLMGGAAARAGAYQPGEFLLLDLNRAALSPKPLGPPAQFEPVPIEAKADSGPPVVAAPATKSARVAARLPAAHARKKLARARSNPLDANASDTRIQVWPCRSGPMCNWRK